MRIRDKAITAEAFIAGLPPARQAKIAARARELIAEEMTLKDLRRARDLTQVQIASILGIGQDHVSRLEQRSDMLLSTLASYVKSMGGELKFVVQFPDRAPVSLASLADVFEPLSPPPRARKRQKRDVAPS